MENKNLHTDMFVANEPMERKWRQPFEVKR